MSFEKHSKFIKAVVKKLKELDDPYPEVITHEGYQYSFRFVNKYRRKLPWITFTPYGSDTRIKAEIMRRAGLEISDEHLKKVIDLRIKHGLERKNISKNNLLAKKFRKRWNSYWNEKAKAIEALQEAQLQFSKPYETIAEPISLMMDEKLHINSKCHSQNAETVNLKGYKPYNEMLDELQ